MVFQLFEDDGFATQILFDAVIDDLRLIFKRLFLGKRTTVGVDDFKKLLCFSCCIQGIREPDGLENRVLERTVTAAKGKGDVFCVFILCPVGEIDAYTKAGIGEVQIAGF